MTTMYMPDRLLIYLRFSFIALSLFTIIPSSAVWIKITNNGPDLFFNVTGDRSIGNDFRTQSLLLYRYTLGCFKRKTRVLTLHQDAVLAHGEQIIMKLVSGPSDDVSLQPFKDQAGIVHALTVNFFRDPWAMFCIGSTIGFPPERGMQSYVGRDHTIMIDLLGDGTFTIDKISSDQWRQHRVDVSAQVPAIVPDPMTPHEAPQNPFGH